MRGWGSGEEQPNRVSETVNTPEDLGAEMLGVMRDTIGLTGLSVGIDMPEPICEGGGREPSGLTGQGEIVPGVDEGTEGSSGTMRNTGRGGSEGPYNWYGPSWRGRRTRFIGGREITQPMRGGQLVKGGQSGRGDQYMNGDQIMVGEGGQIRKDGQPRRGGQPMRGNIPYGQKPGGGWWIRET